MSDQQLLREYLDGGSERAFQSLVQRHVDLVYSTALRRLGDAGLAEEVTQNVFVALARKAPFLSRDVALAAWLHKTTLLEARHRLRGELRRKRREETAIAMSTGAALHGVTQTAPAALASVAAQTALQSARAVSIGGLGLLIAKFMGLTKTQTAALCLLVSAIPVAYEWNALSEVSAEQQNWQVQLNGLRQTLAERPGEQEQIRRRLRVASDTRMHLESEQTRRKALAASIPAGNDPDLYRWSEASEYVRLPKSLFAGIQLYDATMVSSEGSSESVPDRLTWSPR